VRGRSRRLPRAVEAAHPERERRRSCGGGRYWPAGSGRTRRVGGGAAGAGTVGGGVGAGADGPEV